MFDYVHNVLVVCFRLAIRRDKWATSQKNTSSFLLPTVFSACSSLWQHLTLVHTRHPTQPSLSCTPTASTVTQAVSAPWWIIVWLLLVTIGFIVGNSSLFGLYAYTWIKMTNFLLDGIRFCWASAIIPLELIQEKMKRGLLCIHHV